MPCSSLQQPKEICWEERWYESIDPYRDLPTRAGLELPFVHGQMPVGLLAYDLPQP